MLRFITSLTIATKAAQAVSLQMEPVEAALKMCKKYDANKNSTLEYKEFQTAYAAEFDPNGNENNAKRPFAKFDEDGDQKFTC